MILDELLEFLTTYRQAFPHRNIEVKGDMFIHGDTFVTKVNLDEGAMSFPKGPEPAKDETKGS